MNELRNKLRQFNQKIIGFSILLLAVIYFFGKVIFNTESITVITLSLASLSLFLYGYYIVFKEQMAWKKIKINFLDIDILFVALAAIATYYIATVFSLSVIIASSVIGIIGYSVLKKHSIAIYCGSFAGMSSSLIFNFYEMMLVALLCGVIFIIIKNMLNGCGGRLGSIAFASTLLVGTIFGKTTLNVDANYHILLLFLSAFLSISAAYLLRKKYNYSVVMASALPSLLYAIIFELFFKDFSVYPAIFFTASFVGMVDLRRIPNLKYILILAVFMTIIFFVFFNYYNGYGGKMGMSAFIALISMIGLKSIAGKTKRFILKQS
jgi:hypothetical protein